MSDSNSNFSVDLSNTPPYWVFLLEKILDELSALNKELLLVKKAIEESK